MQRLNRVNESPVAEIDFAQDALLLDVDGTLLDIAPTPDQVFVPDTLRETLHRLHEATGGALALVSGRLVATLDRIFAPLRLPAIGGHGVELRRTADGPVRFRDAGLDQELRDRLAAIVGVDPLIVLEDKRSSVSIHYRRVPEREAYLRQKIDAAIKDRADLEILFGKHVMEVKPASFNKGVAVDELMQLEPFRGRRPIFVGDDHTDDSVFAMLPGLGGLGYSVDRDATGALPLFDRPEDVRNWLAGLSESIDRR